MVALIERLLRFDLRASLRARKNRRDFSTRFPGALISPSSIIPQGDISIGRGTYGRVHVLTFHPSDQVSIGRYCSFGPDVLIVAGGGHRTDLVSTYPFRKKVHPSMENTDVVSKGPVQIGHDVWLGARATVLSGVTIGTGAVIAAGSVVVKNVPEFAIAAGNPARVLRYRFDERQRRALLRIAWWYWSESEILERLEDFYLRVDDFINLFDPGSVRGRGI